MAGNSREYHWINALIFLFVLGVLIAVKMEWFAVRCVYAEKGLLCKTCGLTSAFVAILNGNFSAVHPAFLIAFALIGGQLFLRPLISILLLVTQKLYWIRTIDVLTSIGLLITFLILLWNK